jgi:predicted ATPase/transcriptional regulator with XRE-family HTH domain
MKEPSSFGALLKRYRLTAGLSQEGLAARASLSARTISDLERGIHGIPHADTLTLLTGALSLSAQEHALLLGAARPELAASLEAPPDSFSPGFPFPPTRLIGRSQEHAYALDLLHRSETHLLTLTGPSGVGKTRLALQLLLDLTPDFTAGVVYVPLAPIRDATLVAGVIAQAFGLREHARFSLAEQVQAFLHEKHLLLALDNVEQVLDGVSSLVANLLSSCPRLSLLVTSRTPLCLRAEQELRLSPLRLEDAVTLFHERVQAVRPGRTYVGSEVAAICEQVDCLPLAIELAAMHIKVLSLAELRERLTHRLELLRGGARDLPARQQTMEDAIAWSYELLTEYQQRCFRALGVFMGSWTLQAAEAVCLTGDEGAGEEIILALAALVDASLIQAEMLAHRATRFTILELIRDYAGKRLRVAGEEDQCRRRHAAYYAYLAETVMAHFGSEQGVRDTHFVVVLAQELPNARTALQWAEEGHEAELGLRLTGFARLWHICGQMSEAELWHKRMLALDLRAREQGAHAAPLTLRIEKLYGLARTLVRHGQVEQGAEAAASEALQLAQRIDDQSGMSNAFATLGMIAQASGKLDEAEAAFTESYTHARLREQKGLMSRALVGLAEVARMRGDLAHAKALAEEALAQAQTIGITWDIPTILTLLGHLARELQHSAEATVRYREALGLYRTFSSPLYTAGCLEGFAAALCAEGHYAQATRLCAAAATLREQTQTLLSPAERKAFEQMVAGARTALDELAFVREWNTGITFTQGEAIDDALLN